MPKRRIKTEVAATESNADYEDDEDDEVVVVPYVKPPPTIIHLDESDEEDSASNKSSHKHKVKKKHKDKKRDKEDTAKHSDKKVKASKSSKSSSRSSRLRSESPQKKKDSSKTKEKSKARKSTDVDNKEKRRKSAKESRRAATTTDFENDDPAETVDKNITDHPKSRRVNHTTSSVSSTPATASTSRLTSTSNIFQPSSAALADATYDACNSPSESYGQIGRKRSSSGNKHKTDKPHKTSSKRSRTASSKSAEEESIEDSLRFVQRLGLPVVTPPNENDSANETPDVEPEPSRKRKTPSSKSSRDRKAKSSSKGKDRGTEETDKVEETTGTEDAFEKAADSSPIHVSVGDEREEEVDDERPSSLQRMENNRRKKSKRSKPSESEQPLPILPSSQIEQSDRHESENHNPVDRDEDKDKSTSDSAEANILSSQTEHDDLSQTQTTANTVVHPSAQRIIPLPDIFPYHWTPEMKRYYGETIPDAEDVEEIKARQTNDKTKWWHQPEDRRRPPKLVCYICNREGHEPIMCPSKTRMCYMCSERGHKYCPEALCFLCGSKQHTFRRSCQNCTLKAVPLKCSLCGMTGHSDKNCPDHWRRYYKTTDFHLDRPTDQLTLDAEDGKGNDKDGNLEIQGLIRKFKYLGKLQSSCSNCGDKGHNYFHCIKPRQEIDGHFYLPHKPFIIKELTCDDMKEIDMDNTSCAHPNENKTSKPAQARNRQIPDIITRIVVLPVEDRNMLVNVVYRLPDCQKKQLDFIEPNVSLDLNGDHGNFELSGPAEAVGITESKLDTFIQERKRGGQHVLLDEREIYSMNAMNADDEPQVVSFSDDQIETPIIPQLNEYIQRTQRSGFYCPGQQVQNSPSSPQPRASWGESLRTGSEREREQGKADSTGNPHFIRPVYDPGRIASDEVPRDIQYALEQFRKQAEELRNSHVHSLAKGGERSKNSPRHSRSPRHNRKKGNDRNACLPHCHHLPQREETRTSRGDESNSNSSKVAETLSANVGAKGGPVRSPKPVVTVSSAPEPPPCVPGPSKAQNHPPTTHFISSMLDVDERRFTPGDLAQAPTLSLPFVSPTKEYIAIPVPVSITTQSQTSATTTTVTTVSSNAFLNKAIHNSVRQATEASTSPGAGSSAPAAAETTTMPVPVPSPASLRRSGTDKISIPTSPSCSTSTTPVTAVIKAPCTPTPVTVTLVQGQGPVPVPPPTPTASALVDNDKQRAQPQPQSEPKLPTPKSPERPEVEVIVLD